MKKLLYIVFICCSLTVFNGCEYLEKAPGVDVTEDTIFSSRTQVETFVSGTYYYTIMSDQLAYWDQRDKDASIITGRTDECEINASWFTTNTAWNVASVSSTRTTDNRFATHWKGLRRCNILIERIMDAPFNDDAYKKQVLGEAKFMRAYVYFQLFEKYGGVPLLKKRLGPEDQFKIPRATVEKVVNFIVDDCDDAMALLPHHNEYASNQRGRATVAAAMALKARTLLYAASPTFNTGRPYLSLGIHNNLICYGKKDPERWKLAADAAKAAITEAVATGLKLIEDQGVENNYRYVWEVCDNSEIILAEKHTDKRIATNFPWNYFMPKSYGFWITWNFMKMYERRDGKPQPWKLEGNDDLMDMYANMDPRFGQTITYHGQRFNEDYPNMDYAYDAQNKPGRGILPGSCEGAIVHKPVPYVVAETGHKGAVPNALIFKLSEMYLNYAEAVNEYYGPTKEAYDAVNRIRQRSGMPKLPTGLTQDEFRERVRHERAIEFAYDGLRFWDIMRWEIAEDVNEAALGTYKGGMNGKIYGIKQYALNASKTKVRYEPYMYEIRSFKKAMYRYPFPQNEINKGYLIQNPGY